MLNKTVSVETMMTVEIKPPDWLSREARDIWEKKIKELAGSNLPINIDVKTLASFCDSVAQYANISSKRKLSVKDHKALLHHNQNILRYSDTLGFNPLARAKLIAQRAHNLEME